MDEVERRRMMEQLKHCSSLLKLAEAEKAKTQKEREEFVNRIYELNKKMQDLEEEVEASRDLASQLGNYFRQTNDEVEDARTTKIQSKMLHVYGNAEIGMKGLGRINTDGWWEECKDVFRANEEKFSEWQYLVDNLQNVIDEYDEELTKLRKKYGPLVANAVGVAALEIETWNPSGRYPIQLPWDFRADQKASMSQIF